MFYFASLACIFVSLQFAASAPSNAPWKSWTFCKEVGPDENNPCLLKAIKGAEKDLISGSSYFGTPSLDPLDIPELSMHQAGKDRAVAVNITFKDCKILGLGGWELQEIKSDWKNGKIKGVVYLKDPVNLISDYQISGKVILLPITGQGKANITLYDMTALLSGSGKVVKKKNKDFLEVEQFNVELKPKKMNINLENLFNGNKALGDNMNKFLNENWEEIMKEVGTPISQGLGEAFKQISARVFAKIPYDSLILK